MANQLTLTDVTGNVILTCQVDLKIEIDADQANADAINSALAASNSLTIAVVGNSVTASSSNTIIYTNMSFQQTQPAQPDTETGIITISVI